MGFFTKVDYGRQLKQHSGNTVLFSGATEMGQSLNVGSGLTVGQSISGAGEFFSYADYTWSALTTCVACSGCSTANTFVVGSFSSTSATCTVTVTSFSGVTGMSPVLAIGKAPTYPLSGGSTTPGIKASSLQIHKLGLLPVAAVPMDLGLDNDGNVVRGPSSSRRYKTNLQSVPPNRYHKLLGLNSYFFNYKETGASGFGMMAEDLHDLGYRELVIYDSLGRPDNIDYKLLSVALLGVIKNLNINGGSISSESTTKEPDSVVKVINEDYVSNGEYLIVTNKVCKLTLNSKKDTKVKIKSLSEVEIVPDMGKIDNRWDSITLDGDSCVELVFVSELSYWVITSSDGLKDS